jgi:16S rRNA (cytidine1402-2'-O)-methyltransferase
MTLAMHDDSVAVTGRLYVVATPIGHLADVTLRALEVLRSVDVIAAEDTRHTRRLLDHHGIATRAVAVHEHNEARAAEQLLARLARGESVALVTDAGTPAISDPGARVVAAVRAAGVEVVAVPGPSAVVAALSIAGIDSDGFVFAGFLPAKRAARREALAEHLAARRAVVFYEAPHRIVECVEDVAAVCGVTRGLTLARELTKRFESLHDCAAGDAAAWLAADADRTRGEFVLILHPAPAAADGDAQLAAALPTLDVLLTELPPSRAARVAATLTGAPRAALYAAALARRDAAGAHDSPEPSDPAEPAA